jgi:hypothetical protein
MMDLLNNEQRRATSGTTLGRLFLCCRADLARTRVAKGKYQVKVDLDLGPFEYEHDEMWHSI